MNTLEELKSGQLQGATHIKLQCALTEFPAELFTLADSLEVLDLSGNRLSALPADFSRFSKLRIFFASDNLFTEFPAVLAECPVLEMVGFKSNQIQTVGEDALPVNIRWLILTNNEISALPASIGKNTRLQKVALAGNRLSSLPEQMTACANLELLRISANRLTELPLWLLQLPKLSWLAFAGNPCAASVQTQTALEKAYWHDLHVGKLLGEGASGHISQALWQQQFDVAVKIFKGEVTSDGYPADEMAAAIAAGSHENLIEVLAELTFHPEQKSGLILPLIPADFSNLAAPPCLESCTRDNYDEGYRVSWADLLHITTAVASAAAHLHQRGIMHGDLYGHNILINDAAECLLGDFGAASQYHQLEAETGNMLERLEVRAFGHLLQELLDRLQNSALSDHKHDIEQLRSLQLDCTQESNAQRPRFEAIVQTLATCKELH